MLWRIAYTTIQPRAIHIPYLSAMYTFMGKHLHEAFDQYDPDLVVSVHPLMQHINTRVLAARAKRLGRARATPFATVVTDFTTCHNTWFCRSEGGMGSHHRQQMIEPYVSVLCHMQSGCSSRNITQSHCSIMIMFCSMDSKLTHKLRSAHLFCFTGMWTGALCPQSSASSWASAWVSVMLSWCCMACPSDRCLTRSCHQRGCCARSW